MEALNRDGGISPGEPSGDHGSWEFELATATTVWSEGVFRIHGVEAGSFEPTLDSVRPLIHPDDLPTYVQKFRDAVESREPFSIQHRIVRPDGSARSVIVRGAFVPAGDGKPDRYVGTTEDITGRLTYEDRLWQLANRDSLTGLFNRRRFMDELDREVVRAQRTGERGAVLIIDVDDFKDINDSLGHPAGDELLERMGRHLSHRLRATDTLARIGGDEFGVVLPACSVFKAKEIADSLIAALEGDAMVRIAGTPRSVTASIGIASFSPDTQRRGDQLMVEADLAMYRAKAAGGGRVEVFDEEMRSRLEKRIEVEGELQEALKTDQLVLHYQPITSLPDGVPIGCEALVRWQHPERGLVGPDQFIPVAEESGQILELGALVLEHACRQAQEWRRRGRHMHVSVNVSPVQLVRGDVGTMVDRVLLETGLPPQLLYLEVTETFLIDDADRVVPVLQQLRDRGVRIAIDDFGGGSSSLSYLSVLPVDVIKIDRLFIDGLPESSDDRAIVAAVLSLGEELDLRVIAEGVEDQRQHWQLQELGCKLGQGYLYAKPQPAQDLVLDGFATAVQPGVGDPSVIREFMRQIGIPARVGP